MFKLKNRVLYSGNFNSLPVSKLIINTLNAYSYNLAQSNELFREALDKGDLLLPDGISVVWASRFLNGGKLKKIAGFDLFIWEMNRLNKINGTCFFLGSNESTLNLIVNRSKIDFPGVRVFTFSPPYKDKFSNDDNAAMITAINKIKPDVLFVGLTAPKQETWVFQNADKIECLHICSIGAVFDFYAGTVKRAPQWVIKIGFEWFYRLLMEPKRMWRRYILGNFKFIFYILREKFTN